MTQKCMKFTVKGVVQGVGFRYHTCHEGLKRGLTGYAKNLYNGDVEVIACGNSDKVDDFHEWLKEGPRTASVTQLISEPAEVKAYRSFEILY